MGKTDLGKWMITNGGEYSADATYEQLTMVKYGNSTYITLKTVTGITPTDDKINYQLMAQGFDATALSAVQAEDTQGLCGEKGEIVTAQSLVDALADKVMNTVMEKIGTAALTGGMTDLSSGVNSLYSNLIHIKLATYQIGCGTPQSGTTMPFKTSTGLDLTTQSDYPKNCKLIIPLCAYNGDRFGVMAITSNRYLNVNGDNLTYTCVVAYLY